MELVDEIKEIMANRQYVPWLARERLIFLQAMLLPMETGAAGCSGTEPCLEIHDCRKEESGIFL